MNMATVCILLVCTVLHIATASMVNVALGKNTSMSSSKSGYRASTAVDGNTDAGGWTSDKIIDTGTRYSFAWWKVDLQRKVQDATVRIYFRTDYRKRRNGVKLYTSTSPFPTLNPTSQGQLCHTVNGDQSGSDIPDVYNVTCPGRWRYLLLYTDTANDRDGPHLDFGEVEVIECDSGFYGASCSFVCNNRHCLHSSFTCDHVTGQCDGGCLPGYKKLDCTYACNSGSYGPGCSLPCSERNCVKPSTECNHVTGQCQYGCKPGYKGIDCNKQCESGTYGPGCSLSCTDRKCLVQSSACNHVTGQCEGGCQAGYQGKDCRQECDLGVNYGVNCTKSCSDRHCNQLAVCDTKTGQCIDGCQVGRTGVDCKGQCSPGTYGPGCNMACGNCSSEVCDHVTGSCPSGCKAGWRTDKCNEAYGSVQEPVCFGVASLVGAVVGTFLLVVLLGVGIIVGLMRQGRLQWIKNPNDNKHVQESRDFIQMSSIAPRSSDFSEHAQSRNQVHNNDYAVLDTAQMQGNKDYDVIQPKHYQNL